MDEEFDIAQFTKLADFKRTFGPDKISQVQTLLTGLKAQGQSNADLHAFLARMVPDSEVADAWMLEQFNWKSPAMQLWLEEQTAEMGAASNFGADATQVGFEEMTQFQSQDIPSFEELTAERRFPQEWEVAPDHPDFGRMLGGVGMSTPVITFVKTSTGDTKSITESHVIYEKYGEAALRKYRRFHEIRDSMKSLPGLPEGAETVTWDMPSVTGVIPRGEGGGQLKLAKGRFGPAFSGSVDLGPVAERMKEMLIENYKRLGVGTGRGEQTGTLLKALQEGEVVPNISTRSFSFSFTLADIERVRLSGQNSKVKVSTLYYGPRVFFGRPGVIAFAGSNAKGSPALRFKMGGEWIATRTVRPSRTDLNIYRLSLAQRNELARLALSQMGMAQIPASLTAETSRVTYANRGPGYDEELTKEALSTFGRTRKGNWQNAIDAKKAQATRDKRYGLDELVDFAADVE